MSSGNFLSPTVGQAYADVLQSVRDMAADAARGFDGTGTTNYPTNAIRWNSSTSRFEKFNGTTWNVLVSRMAQDVASVLGLVPGNASGNIAVNNGTLNVNLNAALVNGFPASQGFHDANSVVVRQSDGRIGTDNIQVTSNVTGTVPSHFAIQTSSDNIVRWRTLAGIQSDLGIGAGAVNIGAPGTYGAFTCTVATGGWNGFGWSPTINRYLMSTGAVGGAASTGEYEPATGWLWRWDAGALAAGSVPWARLTGVPSFPYYPLTGGPLTGSVEVASEGATNDAYGAISVTKPAGTTGIPSYYGMTMQGAIAWMTGVDPLTANYTIGTNSTSRTRIGLPLFSIETVTGRIYGAAYGWLENYFTRTVTAGTQLSGGGSGPSLTINHATGFSTDTITPGNTIFTDNGHVTNCNCNCPC